MPDTNDQDASQALRANFRKVVQSHFDDLPQLAMEAETNDLTDRVMAKVAPLLDIAERLAASEPVVFWNTDDGDECSECGLCHAAFGRHFEDCLKSKARTVIAQIRADAIPSPIRNCRVCGCTDDNACVGAPTVCHWIEADLCSACRGKG